MKKLIAIIILVAANELIGFMLWRAYYPTIDYVAASFLIPAILVLALSVYIVIVGIWWAISELF